MFKVFDFMYNLYEISESEKQFKWSGLLTKIKCSVKKKLSSRQPHPHQVREMTRSVY